MTPAIPDEGTMGNGDGNGNGNTIKLSLGQIVMFISIIVTLASGWTILKMDQEAMKAQMAAFSQAQTAMLQEINQLREDLVHYGIPRSAPRKRNSDSQ